MAARGSPTESAWIDNHRIRAQGWKAEGGLGRKHKGARVSKWQCTDIMGFGARRDTPNRPWASDQS